MCDHQDTPNQDAPKMTSNEAYGKGYRGGAWEGDVRSAYPKPRPLSGEWRELPAFAKALVIGTGLNTLMLAYDTDWLVHLARALGAS